MVVAVVAGAAVGSISVMMLTVLGILTVVAAVGASCIGPIYGRFAVACHYQMLFLDSVYYFSIVIGFQKFIDQVVRLCPQTTGEMMDGACE